MGDPELQVTGGAGGFEARYEDIALLARHSDDLARSLAVISAECHAVLIDPDVLASAVLDPVGVARFEGALLSALDGREGLTSLAAGIGAHAISLRAVVLSYQVVDEAQARLIDSVRWAVGFVAGPALLLLASSPVGLLAVFGGYELTNGKVDWQRLLTDHPGLVDNTVGASPGLISGIPGLFAGDVPSAAHLLGLLYPDGAAHVAALGVDSQDPSMTRPPESFTDLLSGLDHRNNQNKGEHQGEIDIRVVTHPDGTRAYIVDIPGTRDWQPMPLHENKYLNDLGTNIHGMAGDTTAYQQGVIEALRKAGVGPTDPVMLVGHSQGGLIAAETANNLAASGEFHVTHVVTAASPVGRVPVADGVQMLSLENRNDIVPHLDAADNRDRSNHTTVTFATQNGTMGANHGIGSAYLPAAGALDHSTDPSVTAFRNSASPFLSSSGDGTQVTSYVYQITRS